MMSKPSIVGFSYAVALAGLMAIATQHGEARNREIKLAPLFDASIADSQPYDGVADAGSVSDESATSTGLNSGIFESRTIMEFDVTGLRRRVERAILTITPVGVGLVLTPPIVPIQVFGYDGDGTIREDDFNAGRFVTIFDARPSWSRPWMPVDIDVTDYFKESSRDATGKDTKTADRHEQSPRRDIVGLSFRTNVHGVQLNLGSLEFDPAPTLTLTVR